MEYCRCQPPCSRVIATRTVSVLNGWVFRTRGVVYGISKCKFCKNVRLKTLRTRLAVFERESSVFPCCATEAAKALRESTTWGQEARPSAAYSELVDVLSRTTEKLSIDWPDEPRESQSSKLDEQFLSGPNSRPERRKLPFFSDLHHEISRSWKQPFSSCLTNAAAADFTNLVGSVEQGYTAIPVIEHTLASRHLWQLLGSPAPSFQPNHVGPLPPLSGSPTLQLVRQAWPSTLWPSSKPTRRMSSRRWMRVAA